MTLFVMIVATLYFGKEVLIPVTVALLLAFILAPLVTLLRRLHFGRVPSVLLAVVVALGIVVAIGGVIGAQIAELSTNFPEYAATVEAKISAVREYTVGRLTKLADSIGRPHSGSAAGSPTSIPLTSISPGQGVAAQSAQVSPLAPAPRPETNPLALAERFLAPVLSPLATFGIVFVVSVFALLQREDLRDRLIRLAGSDDLHQTTLAIDDGGRRLGRYFATQLSVNSAFGLVVGTGLLIIGVPSPVLWGLLSALLRFVPYVGSAISVLLPAALAAAVEPGWSMVLWTLALYAVVEGVTGQVIEPMVYGHSTGLSPFSVIVAAIFWSWLWGPVGLILSTPLTLCLVVLGRHVERLEFLDVMLGDRAALTPVESFYQRILAGDADEAEDHADQLLKECSLSTYYDEVALKGLQLAANDAKRGALDGQQLDRIKATVRSLVRGLARHEDKQPPASKSDRRATDLADAERDVPRNPDPASVPEGELPASWRDSFKVLCIAGRGPLDQVASWMLAQLLGKHGLGARVVDYMDVSRDGIETLDVDGVAMACVSYLNITGSPAHLRYLILRLRQRLPAGIPILVGFWPSADTALTDLQVQTSIGADVLTSSLRQAVTSCVEAARKTDERDGVRFAARPFPTMTEEGGRQEYRPAQAP